jgi:trimeric autotransporter adhesin
MLLALTVACGGSASTDPLAGPSGAASPVDGGSGGGDSSLVGPGGGESLDGEADIRLSLDANQLDMRGNQVISLRIDPVSDQVLSGVMKEFTAPFKALAGNADDTETDVTDSAVWTSSSSRIAFLSKPGVFVPVSLGTVTIQATYQGASATASLLVAGNPFLRFRLEVPANVLALGEGEDLTLWADYQGGYPHAVNGAATWESNPPGVITLSPSGHVLAVGGGSAQVEVKIDGSVVGSAQISVPATSIRSIAIVPSPVDIDMSDLRQLVATGTFADGSTLDLTKVAAWSRGSDIVAFYEVPIQSHGLLQTVLPGTTTVTARWGGVEQSAPVQVRVGNLTDIMIDDIELHRFEIAVGLIAFANYPNGGTYDFASVVSWSTDNPAIASIVVGPDGPIVVGRAPGNTKLRATLQGRTGIATVTVLPTALVSIEVTPAVLFLPPPQTFRVTGTYGDGSTAGLNWSTVFNVADTSIATVSNAAVDRGLATSLAAGKTTITATVGSISATAGITAFH